MPVYAMGTVILPAKVITKLTAIMRNFFWGGNAEKRKLLYVAWDTITTPKGMGGLGLRSLTEMNKALVLKTVWRVANEVDALWIQALRAKYFPRSTFWNTNRTYNCSKLWRDIVHIKLVLQFSITWKVGSGEGIKAFSQPWFPNWTQHRATSNQQREIRVSDLIHQHTRTWNFEALQALFGFQEALNISMSEELKLRPEEAPDTLIFTFARNGKFTVTKAYQLLRGDIGNAADKVFWTWVWKNGGLIPKLKLFIWRCVKNALPVRAILSAIVSAIDPICPICKNKPETVMHALFECDFARAFWWSSNLGIRSDSFQGDYRSTIQAMIEVMSDKEVTQFVCITWAVWRSRNDAVMGGKSQNMPLCNRYYSDTQQACNTLGSTGNTTKVRTVNTVQPVQQTQRDVRAEYECYVDGSWSEDGRAGVGLYLTRHGIGIKWLFKSIQALGPTQAEARGILEAYTLMQSLRCTHGTVYSDCLETVDSLSHNSPRVHDWRSYDHIWSAWLLQSRAEINFKVEYRSREEQGIQIAHNLANQGRIRECDMEGEDMEALHTEETFPSNTSRST